MTNYPRINIKCELDNGSLIVRGDIDIPKYELCFSHENILEDFRNMDTKIFLKQFSEKHLKELEKYIDSRHKQAKEIILTAAKQRFHRIFGYPTIDE